jgi:hypothetical protein
MLPTSSSTSPESRASRSIGFDGPPPPGTLDAFLEMCREMESIFSGVSNYGRPIILPAGVEFIPMNWNPPNVSPCRPIAPLGSGGYSASSETPNRMPPQGGSGTAPAKPADPKLTSHPRYTGDCKGCHRTCWNLQLFDEGHYCREACMLRDRRRRRESRVFWGRIGQRIDNFLVEIITLHV